MMPAFTSDKPIYGVGVGLRHQHLRDVLEKKPDINWFEVHTENFFSPGSNASHYLETIRHNYPLSAHGVGLSLGSADGLDEHHLAAIKHFITRYQPSLVSEHVSWSTVDNTFLSDLLPLPYTEEALDVICRNIIHMQDYLGRQVLVENPSSYMTFAESIMPEWEFMNAIAKRTGCGLLLDVNNIYVSSENHGWSATEYLYAINQNAVQEIHIAGHAERELEGHILRIDDHGSAPPQAVWKLYGLATQRFPNAATLLEWDNNIPSLDTLISEAQKAETYHAQAA